MQNDLTKLPLPPTGQIGMNLNQFSHLPPPPKGQQGFTLDQIKSQQSMPLASGTSDNFGQNLLTSAKDVATGAGKDLLGTAVGTAGLLQGAGKGILGAFGADTSKLGFNSLDTSTPEGAGVAQSLTSQNRGEQIGGILSAGGQLAAPFAGGNAEKLVAKGKSLYDAMQASREAKATEEASSKITEMISPKATAKEARLATSQGRFIEGKKPTLFRAGTEDTITPSNKTLSASKTIQQNIPNASKMTPTELYGAVDKNITDTATKLRPQMEATPIKPETIQKLNSDWEALKKTQMAEAPATEEANVAKRQAKFESILKKSGSGSHADLWDTRINYDNSIPDNVKKATTMSSDSLQLQKQEWLDNRKILNDAIDSSAKPEFKQMSNMYEAKTGLLSKAKVNEAQMSKINQFLKNNPKTAKVLGGATAYEVLKGLGVPLP